MPKLIKMPPKEDIINYYINEKHSRDECAKYFRISGTTFDRWCKKYQIYDSEENRLSKIRQTNMQKYGCAYSILNKDVRAKRTKTLLAKYGVDNVFKSLEVQTKINKTIVDKYGSKTAKALESINKKYGVKTPSQIHLTTEAVKVLNDIEFMRAYIKTHFKHKPSMTELAKKIGCSDAAVFHSIKRLKAEKLFAIYHSACESELAEYVKQYAQDVRLNVRTLLQGHSELDIVCGKLAFEYNGTYWHSALEKEKNYHFNKSKIAESNGIRLIHVYEYEWNDPVKREIIKSLIKIALGVADKKIYARNCEIREISNNVAKPFNDKNHLQGHRDAQVTYGLYYNDELVQLMSFSRTKYNRNIKDDESWEIIRGCPGSNNIVVGGVSKLFKHFIKEHAPRRIFSYCDFNKFDGSGYEAIGMHFIGYTGPDMKWVMPDFTVIERNPKKHKEYKEKALTQIWGAGSKKYLWEQ